jgi:hypothetical protein
MTAITKDRFTASAQINLYDKDFYAWTQQTAELLKSHRFGQVDWDHLVEEVEDMGKSELRGFRSMLGNLLHHLLKLNLSPSPDPRNGWIDEIARFRVEIQRILDDNPSFKSKKDDVFPLAWKDARSMAKTSLERDGVKHIPENCPYTYEQAIKEDFFPNFDPGYEHLGLG